MVVRYKLVRRLALVAAIPLVSAGLLSSAQPAQAASRAAVTGGTAAWTANTHNLGRPAATRQIAVQVYLAPRGGEAALNAAVAAVSTPGSASYRHFLSVPQYLAAYEPTAAQVSSVSAWLRSSGLRVTGVGSSRRSISASGTVRATEQAFGTTLGTFRHNGQLVTAPSVAATIPSTVSSAVLAVTGLDSTVGYAKPALTGPPPAFENARPCSIYYGQIQAKFKADYSTPLPKFGGVHPDYAVCGYAPDQFRAAYEGATTLSGSGVTVAITDAYGAASILQDANTFSTINGDSAFAAGQYSETVAAPAHQGLCGPTGWAGEETLDVEAVHGLAPNANVHYYGAKSCLDADLLAAIQNVVDDNTASIVTNSWGEPEEVVSSGVAAAYQQTFNQAALQGISVVFSSGDSGDEVANTGLRQADWPDSSPDVTAVGGTSTEIGPTGALIGQTGWGTQKFSLSANGKSWVPIAANPFLYGSGGGYSALFNRPAYQTGVVPVGQSGRAVPDVALDGDPTTGMLVGETQLFPNGRSHFSEYRIGGTSVASPLFAGMTALAEQNAGKRLGLLNPAIYGQARSHAGTFTDVLPASGANVRPDYVNGVDPSSGTVYSVRTFNNDSSLLTTSGWDDVTGVGTPNAGYLTAF